ncbi:hypothetical protein [Oceanicaulis sp. MMSF_3324]|uniref:hypothetical protein n=1 Tax=Oceanicaulis sp. MMSF_3324 TaxID=3046702 RepID=UPI00273D4D5B|nr:hypothetical protein [Oceanicaulis sp. MMSF_3324]
MGFLFPSAPDPEPTPEAEDATARRRARAFRERRRNMGRSSTVLTGRTDAPAASAPSSPSDPVGSARIRRTGGGALTPWTQQGGATRSTLLSDLR